MNPDILQAIATGLVTILGFFMFYDSKKRTEAAACCVGWCMSVSVVPTLVILTAYLSYAYYSRGCKTRHPWYWAEVSGFADVFVTYIIMYSQGSL